MKSRDTVVRLKRFQVEEKRRRVAQIEMMMADFGRIAAELDREIAHEEQKTGISDPHHFAYSTYARAASQRRDNLRRSAEDLTAQLDEAKADLGEAFEDLRKAESIEGRERAGERATEALRDGVMAAQAGARPLRAPA